MLYHFSDDSGIKTFVPRVIGNFPPLVWAIDEAHCINYYFPRHCPRIIYGKSENSTPHDLEKFFENTSTDRIVTIPDYMEEELNEAVIYKYTFNGNGFELQDKIAGYYTSPNNVTPLSVEPISNLARLIAEAGAELRFTDDLMRLRERILNSTIDNFSMIRLKHLNKSL